MTGLNESGIDRQLLDSRDDLSSDGVCEMLAYLSQLPSAEVSELFVAIAVRGVLYFPRQPNLGGSRALLVEIRNRASCQAYAVGASVQS